MNDLYFKFTNRDEYLQAFRQIDWIQFQDDILLKFTHTYALQELGEIIYDNGTGITTLTGFHVNLRVISDLELPPSLSSFQLFPTTPFCVWFT